MHLFKKTLLFFVTVVLGLLCQPAYGKFYQYTDVSGVKRFTDDIASVPPAQRTGVKMHESVKSDPVQPARRVQNAGTHSPDMMPPSGDALSQTGKWHEKINSQAKDLDRKQAHLNKTYQSLQAEREALAAKAPPAGASAETRAAYRRQVKQLNQKIDAYESQHEDYKKKVKAFNDQYRK